MDATAAVILTLAVLWAAVLSQTYRLRRKQTQEAVEAYLYLAPAGLVLLLFWFIPVALSVFISLTDWSSASSFATARFTGLANYRRAFTEPTFWTTFWNTVNYVLWSVPLTVVAALGVAMALNNRLVRGRNALRTVYFLPFVTTWVAISIVFRYVFDERAGLANYGLQALGLPTYAWLNESRGVLQILLNDALHVATPASLHPMAAGPSLAMFAIILTSVWRDTGYFMVIFLAGLQNIDRSYYEAAEIDGAGAWQRFRHVTLPLLSPTTLFVMIIALITAFKVFVPMYVMTPSGGPGKSTATLVFYVFEQGFTGGFDLGYASAVAYILFFIILALTKFQDVVFGKKVHYD